MMAQSLNTAEIMPVITCPQVFVGARAAMGPPAEPSEYCIRGRTGIHGCRPGCFP